MKAIKKILVGVAVLAILVTSFALTASATTVATADNLEDVLEYHVNEDFLIDNFNTTPGKYTLTENNWFEFTAGNTTNLAEIAEVGENGVLKLTTKNNKEISFTSNFGEEGVMGVVTSFRFNTSDLEYYMNTRPQFHQTFSENPVNGAKFSIVFNCGYEKPAISTKAPAMQMFSINCHPNEVKNAQGMNTPAGDGVYTFTYLSVAKNENNVLEYKEAVIDTIAPKLDTWYQVDLIFNFETDLYSLSIKSDDGEEVVLTDLALGDELLNVKGVTMKIDDGHRNGTVTMLDNLNVYEGTFLRDPSEKDAKTAIAVHNIETLLNDSSTTTDVKIRCADVLKAIVDSGYVAGGSDAQYVQQFLDKAKATEITKIYVEAFSAYANEIPNVSGYYNRKDHVAKMARFDEMFDAANESAWSELPGYVDSYTASIKAAKNAYADECEAIERTKSDSEAFVEMIMQYDSSNKDYRYIIAQFEALSLFEERDVTYRYARENNYSEKTHPYPTVQVAEDQFALLVEKAAAINDILLQFRIYVAEMKTYDLDVVKIEGEVVPYFSTVDFGGLYESYLNAASYYNGGVFHPGLDNGTVDGLDKDINDYLEMEKYVLSRVEETEKFLYYVSLAKSSVNYLSILENLNEAEVFIDDDKSVTVEIEYAGVADAIAEYNSLRVKLANNVKDAENYKNAVAAIDLKADYNTLKAKASAAQALQAGAVMGIDGIKEANIKLSEALAIVAAKEGHSKTLIESVTSLKEETSLAKRRELILTAKEHVAGAEDQITGVSAAKTDLTAAIASYDADVKAANDAFSGVTKNVCTLSSAAAPNDIVYKVVEIIKNLFA